ncbi:hypothetical protein [Prochlorococcus sp. MIT 1306]|uniref:hypothetical protein n=1 Tax=Prochlorococcus sp. MIT 1306 TaxID=1799667 RepID=UPI0012E9803A|nr:hypothetical protein [Prochlorococcus sp. MIT 1306]
MNFSYGNEDGTSQLLQSTEWLHWHPNERGASAQYPLQMSTSGYEFTSSLRDLVFQFGTGLISVPSTESSHWVGDASGLTSGESVFMNIDPIQASLNELGLSGSPQANAHQDFLPAEVDYDFLRYSPDVKIELTSDFVESLTQYTSQNLNESSTQLSWASGQTNGTREVSLDVLVDESLTQEEKYNYLREKLDTNLEIDADIIGIRWGNLRFRGQEYDNPGQKNFYLHLIAGDNDNNDWAAGSSGIGGQSHPTDDLTRLEDAVSETANGTNVEFAINHSTIQNLVNDAGRYFDEWGHDTYFSTNVELELDHTDLDAFLAGNYNNHGDNSLGFRLVGSMEAYELAAAAAAGEGGLSFDFTSDPTDTVFDFGLEQTVDVFDLIDKSAFNIAIDTGAVIDGYEDTSQGSSYLGVNYSLTIDGTEYSTNGQMGLYTSHWAGNDSESVYVDNVALARLRNQNENLIGTDTTVSAEVTQINTGFHYYIDGLDAFQTWDYDAVSDSWSTSSGHGDWGDVDLDTILDQIVDAKSLNYTIENLFTDDLPDIQIASVKANLNGFGDGRGYPSDAIAAFTYELYEAGSNTALDQLGVLGQTVGNQRFGGIDYSKRYELQVTGETLADNYSLEGADITIAFDPVIFKNITAEDIQIGKNFNVANAVEIDNEAGTIRIAAASLGDLGEGSPITNETVLASIALDFDEQSLANPAPGESEYNNADGSLFVSPLTFNITANQEETVFSRKFNDGTGFTNREISSLSDLGGAIAVEGQDVTLYQALINIEEQGDGLIIGTDRVIGSDATFTNLIRSGDTVSATSEWLNVGNTDSNNLVVSAYGNANAELVGHSFVDGKTSLNSGNFKNGVFIEDDRESTKLVADIKVTGDAGKVVDLADGILSITADDSDVFINEKGSSNLITYQGDLNYDGRVSMKDLAYLNAGAARQQSTSQNTGEDLDNNGVVDASVAHDVDADFNGKIDLADLSVLDADWGKSLHDGDQNFVGSGDVSWNELDSQGTTGDAAWDNDSFKNQNAIESSPDYVGSLEAPGTTGVIGADGNENANDDDMQGDAFQDPLTL